MWKSLSAQIASNLLSPFEAEMQRQNQNENKKHKEKRKENS